MIREDWLLRSEHYMPETDNENSFGLSEGSPSAIKMISENSLAKRRNRTVTSEFI